MRNNSRINMTCQFIFKVGLPQWRSYTFFNECSLCTLYSSKEIPIAAILLNAAIYILRHCWFSNRQKEAAALKIKATASKARESVSALRQLFFLLPSFGRFNHIFYLTCNSIIKTKCCRNLLTIFFFDKKTG